ncbi:MAG: ParA family protein [bacterium]
MRIIAIVNQKGGSGKTTTSINLAATLAASGRRVLLVDLDPQFSATQWMDISNVGRGVFDLLADPEMTPTQSLIRSTSCENVSIIPSSPWLVGAEKALAGQPGAEQCLREKLDELTDKEFDYVLIDCPPTLGVLTVNALNAARELLVPVECHVMGLHGLAQLMKTVDLVKKRLNPHLRICGIVACRVDRRTRHGKEVVEILRERFATETFKTEIRENVRLAECPSQGVPITVYAPTSPGAEDFRSLAKELISQETNKTER